MASPAAQRLNSMKRAGLLTFVLFCALAPAHEVSTHKRIGDAAVAYLYAAYSTPQAGSPRPVLLASPATLQQVLQVGEEHEDDGFVANAVLGVTNPYGRFNFHFFPALSSKFQLSSSNYELSAKGCSSVNWGLGLGSPNGKTGCSIACSAPWVESGFCESIAGVLQTNRFRWDQDLATDDSGAPTLAAVTGLGYVVHLLQDLGSPAHSRNDPHPCAAVVDCDQFEKFNDNRAYPPFGDPRELPGNVWQSFLSATLKAPGVVRQVIPTAGFSAPVEFFNALQAYVSANYYSNRTVFQGSGPARLFSDEEYFYGACLTISGIAVSEIAGTCLPVVDPADGRKRMARKLAHKGALYWATCSNPVRAALGFASEAGCDATQGEIDQTVGREQFAELGPVIAQHVAALLQFYAPALSVQMEGAGSVASSPGTGILCRTGACSALFIQGATVTLQASGPGFVKWGGDCSSGGKNPAVTVTLVRDMKCDATFRAAR